MTHSVTKAIIPVAGLGTRFYPATKAIAKELLPVYDTPVIELIVREAAAAGITDIIFVTSPTKHAIHEHFTPNAELEELLTLREKTEALAHLHELHGLARFHFRTQDVPMGDGHAIWCADDLIGDDESVLVLFGDDLIDNPTGKNAAEQLLAEYDKTQAAVVALTQIPQEESDRYGIVQQAESGAITHIIEKPDPADAPSNLAVVGKFVLTPAVLEQLRGVACDLHHSPKQEIRLVDALQRVIVAGGGVQGVRVVGDRFDTGHKLGLLEASVHWARKVHPGLKFS